jgi:GT2 family glycosyltransferase
VLTTTAIILNWNSDLDALSCLRSVLESESDSVAAIVVDNGSTSDSVDRISSWIWHRSSGCAARPSNWLGSGTSITVTVAGRRRQVALARLAENRGYAGGNNVGLRLARSWGSEFVWVLNSDTSVDPKALPLLVARIRANPRLAVVGSLLTQMDRPDRIDCIGGGWFNPVLGRNTYAGRGEVVEASAKWIRKQSPLGYISGASMFCATAALASVGDLSEDYFLFYEELDLCARLKGAGWEWDVEPRAIVYHRGSATTWGPHRAFGSRSPWTTYHATRSLTIYMRKHHRGLAPLAIAIRTVIGILALVVRPVLGKAILRGLRDGLRGRASVDSAS